MAENDLSDNIWCFWGTMPGGQFAGEEISSSLKHTRQFIFSFLSLLESRVLKNLRKCILFVTKEVHFYSNFLPVGTSVAINSSHYRIILVLKFFSHFNLSFSFPKGLMCTRKNPNHHLIQYRTFGDTNLTNRRTTVTGEVYYQLYLARNL